MKQAGSRARGVPKPQGMGGSPIVVLYEAETEGKSRIFPVVAVGTKYRRNTKILIGTDIQFVAWGDRAIPWSDRDGAYRH